MRKHINVYSSAVIEHLASVYDYSPNYGGFPPECGIDGTQDCAYSSRSRNKPLYYAIEWPYTVTFNRIAVTGIGGSHSWIAWDYRTWNSDTGTWNEPFWSTSGRHADYVNDSFNPQTTTKLKLTLTQGEGKLELDELWVYGSGRRRRRTRAQRTMDVRERLKPDTRTPDSTETVI